MYEEPAQGGFVVGALGFLAGALISWFAVVRPLFRHIIDGR